MVSLFCVYRTVWRKCVYFSMYSMSSLKPKNKNTFIQWNVEVQCVNHSIKYTHTGTYKSRSARYGHKIKTLHYSLCSVLLLFCIVRCCLFTSAHMFSFAADLSWLVNHSKNSMEPIVCLCFCCCRRRNCFGRHQTATHRHKQPLAQRVLLNLKRTNYWIDNYYYHHRLSISMKAFKCYL